MAEIDTNLVERYLVTVRIGSPARAQDFRKLFYEIWNSKKSEILDHALIELHDQLVKDSNLVQVRKGTYILSRDSFEIAGKAIKERTIDNARLFLMKKQRRDYYRDARRFGLVAASVDPSKMKTT